jgi:hypothetical protein
MFKKGYVLIMLFALFVATAGTLKYRHYIKRDFNEMSVGDIGLRIAFGFLLYVIPGILLVRWYYKMKNK